MVVLAVFLICLQHQPLCAGCDTVPGYTHAYNEIDKFVIGTEWPKHINTYLTDVLTNVCLA